MTGQRIEQLPRGGENDSAADVLPRPTWEGCTTPELPPPQSTETPRRNGHTPQQPSGDALAMLTAMSPEELATLVKLAKALGAAG